MLLLLSRKTSCLTFVFLYFFSKFARENWDLIESYICFSRFCVLKLGIYTGNILWYHLLFANIFSIFLGLFASGGKFAPGSYLQSKKNQTLESEFKNFFIKLRSRIKLETIKSFVILKHVCRLFLSVQNLHTYFCNLSIKSNVLDVVYMYIILFSCLWTVDNIGEGF